MHVIFGTLLSLMSMTKKLTMIQNNKVVVQKSQGIELTGAIKFHAVAYTELG